MIKYFAELLGTAALVLIGCGAVTIGSLGGVLGGTEAYAPLAILPIAIAFGITVTAMAYGIGPVSGCHINPAVTAAVWSAGRMPTGEAIRYVIAQVIGGVLGAALLYLILKGRLSGYDIQKGGLGENGWGEGYLGAYSLSAAILAEFAATFLFTTVILGVTSKAGHVALAGLAIGLTLMVLHLGFINVTGLSVNPARSLGPALFVGGKALAQVWMFIIVPVLGGLLAGAMFRAKILEA